MLSSNHSRRIGVFVTGAIEGSNVSCICCRFCSHSLFRNFTSFLDSSIRLKFKCFFFSFHSVIFCVCVCSNGFWWVFAFIRLFSFRIYTAKSSHTMGILYEMSERFVCVRPIEMRPWKKTTHNISHVCVNFVFTLYFRCLFSIKIRQQFNC